VNRARCVVLGALALAASVPCAAGLPDWAEAIASAVPEPPPYDGHESSRVLHAETRAVVADDGRMRIERRVAVQTLSPHGDSIEIAGYAFDDRARILRSRAWHLPPAGKGRRERLAEIDLADDSVFLTDAKTRLVGVGDAERGSLVFFEFQAEEELVASSWMEPFYEGAPIERKRFVLDVPPGWSVRHAWLRTDGPEPAVVGSTRTWELTGLDPPLPAPLADAPADGALSRPQIGKIPT